MCSIFYPGEIFLENASCYRVIALHTRRSVCVLPNTVLPGKPRARAHARKSKFPVLLLVTQIMAIERAPDSCQRWQKIVVDVGSLAPTSHFGGSRTQMT